MSDRRNRSLPANLSRGGNSESPPSVPQFTEVTRENYERFMSNERRGYDSSTPNYSLDDISLLFSQHPPRQNQDNQSTSEAPPFTPAAPESEDSNVPTLACVDDLLNAPGRRNLPYLSKNREDNSIWFRRDPTGKITKQLLKMLKSDLPKPYPTYRALPQDIKNRWFRAFAQEFNWDSSINETVRNAYAIQADLSFRSNLHEWKKIWKNRGVDDLPEWMKAKKSLFQGYSRLWADEKVAKRAAKNSKNRSSDRGGLGIAIHNNGAKTYERRWDELMSQNNGAEPDMLKLLKTLTLAKRRKLSLIRKP